MKQYMNRLLTIAAVLLASAGAWAGEVTIIVTPNNAAGTVVARLLLDRPVQLLSLLLLGIILQ